MQNDEQYEQLILQYNQLKNGAEDIYKMISAEDYDGAMTMIKSRESVFLNCKCMRRYLDLTPEQEATANKLFEEIKALEKRNIDVMNQNLKNVELELKKVQKSEKIQQAYDYDDETQKGSIVNIQE